MMMQVTPIQPLRDQNDETRQKNDGRQGTAAFGSFVEALAREQEKVQERQGAASQPQATNPARELALRKLRGTDAKAFEEALFSKVI